MGARPQQRPLGLRSTIVNACLRDGAGGSPTAVMLEPRLNEPERRSLPGELGTSHVVFVAIEDDGRVSLRFFTAQGELPACGHGTVAALAFLAEHAGEREYEATLNTAAGSLAGRAFRSDHGGLSASFDVSGVERRAPTTREHAIVLAALGALPESIGAGGCVASPGRPRLLLPISTRSALMALRPDYARLAEACAQLDLLGCYVYTEPGREARIAARMFAPAVGVPEDIANANSTACLAAHLARSGRPVITVDMGDALGTPATITATVLTTAAGTRIRVGGHAAVARTVHR
ncbi:MAG: PhzF family phenazine biosynthesis protein [Solirubrobacterales bacterium]|nr:PhzF family phenazine biosynthesis protein [Solirubrobacterales bacterium]